MNRPPGPRPKLSESSVERILNWRNSRYEFLSTYGTREALAVRLGLKIYHVVRELEHDSLCAEKGGVTRLAARGPLTNEQRSAIAAWGRAYREFVTKRPTAAQLAVELKVSRAVIFDCLKRKGRYTTRRSNTDGPRGSRRAGKEEGGTQRSRALASWPVVEFEAGKVGPPVLRKGKGARS